jgi:hypothetical protein
LSWENILVKSPYYEIGKKGNKKNTPLFLQPPNPTQEIIPSPSPQYHLIKLLYFSSSLKPRIKKKTLER